jgi:hypothetical protein
MAATLNVFICAAVALVLWTGIGLAVARRIVPGLLAWSVAPVLGWAVHSAALLPILGVVGFSRATVAVGFALPLIVAIVALAVRKPSAGEKLPIPIWPFIGAALIALIPMMAILPKAVADGVTLAAPIFDHSKIALIDEMARLGVPPGNPFFGGEGSAAPLSYYYLWHFSAAELAALLGFSGWEADAALTWFTAFATLALGTGLASWLSGRAAAAIWALVLALTVSIRPVLEWFAGIEAVEHAIGHFSGLSGLLFQASWAPQHVASAACVVLAVILMSRMTRASGVLDVVALALVVAAGVESSTWVGGVLFTIAAPVCALAILLSLAPADRTPFLVTCAFAGVIAICVAFPMLRDQYVATAMRIGGAPVVVQPWEVLGPILPEPIRRLLDLPAYWLILWVVELPAIYLIGLAAMTGLLRANDVAPDLRRSVVALAALALTGMMAAWLLASTVGTNNDFGWRAILPAIIVLTGFAAAGLARWMVVPRRSAPLAAALAVVAVGLPDGTGFFRGSRLPATPSVLFAQAPAMWAAVRKNAGPADRVANNPLFLREMTPWPVNISWALMADRRSCYAGAELAVAFVPLPEARRKQIDDQFMRVFAGNATSDDIQDLAFRYNCRVILVTSEDGAWARDPFASSPYYRLVETEAGKWRIYGRVAYARSDALRLYAPQTARHQIPANQLNPRSSQYPPG